MAAVELHHIASPQGLQRPGQAVLALRGDEQVHMVGHQHIGVHPHAMQSGRLAQCVEVAAPVLVVDKHRLPVVAPLQQVVERIGQDESGLAGHDQGR
jgi:hypothetical protein